MYEKENDVYTTNGSARAQIEVDQRSRDIRLGLFIAIMLVTFFGNLNIVYQLIRKRFLRVNFYWFVLHLCSLYVVFGLLVLPGYTIQFYMEGYWPLGPQLCVIWNLLNNMSVYEMEATVVLIASDRLWALAFPLHYRAHRTRQSVQLCIALSWLYTCITVWPIVVRDRVLHSYNDTTCDISVPLNLHWWRYTITMGFIITSLCSLYVILAGKLVGNMLSKKRSKVAGVAFEPSQELTREADRIHSLSQKGSTVGITDQKKEEKVNTVREKRVLSVVVIVVVNYTFCLLPYAVYATLWLYDALVPDLTIFFVTQFLMYLHPATDALALMATNPELRPDFCQRRTIT